MVVVVVVVVIVVAVVGWRWGGEGVVVGWWVEG